METKTRQCTICEEVKELTTDNFAYQCKKDNKFHTRCKSCKGKSKKDIIKKKIKENPDDWKNHPIYRD